MNIELVIPGKPMGKERPRAVRRGKFIGTYTPVKTVNYETYIKELFAVRYPDFIPLEGELMIHLTIWSPIPKSTSKKKKMLMLDGMIRPGKKPDIDQVLKIVMDALETVAYKNDNQFVGAVIAKYYSDRPRLQIKITKAELQEWANRV